VRILVAGAAGFLGSHLCDALVKDPENHVIGIDNMYTGSNKNLSQILDKKNFVFINHDVTNPISIDVDQIYNLACPASPVHYQRRPVQTMKTGFLGSLSLLELATEQQARILQASTSEVYGDPLVSPQSEDYWGNVNPIGLRSCYDESKRAAESLFFDFHRQYKTGIKIARIFNTYGPRLAVQDGRVISNFIVQAISDMPLTIYGSGQQTRSFCYVSDLIRGLVTLMNSSTEVTGPINLGNPTENTMLEIAETILKLTDSKSKIEFQDLPSDDPKQRLPDINRAKSVLGWSPFIPLEVGLLETIKYFKDLTGGE
jgi:UDP-glucuronate decarboxylase